MAQKPATPTPRKADAAKKSAVKAPAGTKPVKKVGGTQASPPGNLDALVDQYLAAVWLQAFKGQLAVRIAKVILAREATEGSK